MRHFSGCEFRWVGAARSGGGGGPSFLAGGGARVSCSVRKLLVSWLAGARLLHVHPRGVRNGGGRRFVGAGAGPSPSKEKRCAQLPARVYSGAVGSCNGNLLNYATMAPFCGTEHFRLRYLTLHVARVKEPGLAFRNWFRKPKPAQEHVPGPRVLVCSLDPRFGETVIADHKVYRRFFPDSTAAVLDSIHELLDFVGRGYDILHLLCDVSAAGFIRDLRDQTISGTELIDACLAANVKLLWFASDNPSDGYRNFDLKYARLNVVMTLERKGEKFPASWTHFFRK